MWGGGSTLETTSRHHCVAGANIIDLMLLVVDVNKGMQTQTAECLIIGQITCSHMILVLNKVDLLPKESRSLKIQQVYLFLHYDGQVLFKIKSISRLFRLFLLGQRAE